MTDLEQKMEQTSRRHFGTSMREHMSGQRSRQSSGQNAFAQLSSLLEQHRQRRSAQQLVTDLNEPGQLQLPGTSQLPKPEMDAEGMLRVKELQDDYTRAGRALEKINQFVGRHFSPQDMGAMDMTPSRTQPQDSTGYYTNESGAFYHLNSGDEYYGGRARTERIISGAKTRLTKDYLRASLNE